MMMINAFVIQTCLDYKHMLSNRFIMFVISEELLRLICSVTEMWQQHSSHDLYYIIQPQGFILEGEVDW